MAAPGQVADAQAEALAASSPDGSQRDGVQDSGPDSAIPLPGQTKDEVEWAARHENLRDELPDERCWAVR